MDSSDLHLKGSRLKTNDYILVLFRLLKLKICTSSNAKLGQIHWPRWSLLEIGRPEPHDFGGAQVARFHLHAGNCIGNRQDCVSNFVISSYPTSLSSHNQLECPIIKEKVLISAEPEPCRISHIRRGQNHTRPCSRTTRSSGLRSYS